MILEMTQQQLELDETGKLLDFFLTELIPYFESLGDSASETLWIALLETLKWSIQFKSISGKPFEKRIVN